ncbi:MAG: UDP-N-acetylglucosamine--N-acetylmuramyl-(pentapeptide) pyrophosphoryl-undecaprenol N-acetylglucosamine transferase, partial [Verrucomicrobia bacterium]|nr:UDP-N-acetylglucosamine--N-acetylmuramyl-(pentapeptide) pyrophosphoryl-undecaprenol N-acetylglucosamine transferase [Verrucomicrobiota bacterium]
PAQALARELQEQLGECKILFLAKGLQNNSCFSKTDFSFVDISASPISSLRACINIPRGIWQSTMAMRQFAPDLVVGFGSYHTFPVLCAATMTRVPMVLHVADCIPGRVNKLFSGRALFTGTFFPEAKAYLKGTVCQSQIPLRAQFYPPLRPSREAAHARYGFSAHKKTVLVFGGSQGASKLNQLVSAALHDSLQVLHFTGSQSDPEEIKAAYARGSVTAVVQRFEHEMQYAWAAADLVITRAGASTIAEQLAFGVPGILIPYPYAMDQHQDKNARFVEDVVGGARRLPEQGLTSERLAVEIDRLLEEAIYKKMQAALTQAQADIAELQFSKQILKVLG